MRVALIRHPLPLVAACVCYGRLDVPVHGDAAVQIADAVGEIAGFSAGAVWSSPALRCRAMAVAVGVALALAPVWDPRLLELDFGDWEGRAWDDVPRDALDLWAADPWGFAAPGGETGASLVARVKAFHAVLVSDDRDCVVVSHGGPLKVLHALLLGCDVDLLAVPQPIGSVVMVSPAG